MKRIVTSIACALALTWAAAGIAEPPAAVAPEAEASTTEEVEQAAWVKRLDEAQARLVAAQKSVAKLEGKKGEGASRRYPRGDAKAKYLTDLAAARTELNDATEAMPVLLEEARQAGVPVGVLDRYDSDIEDAGVSDADDES